MKSYIIGVLTLLSCISFSSCGTMMFLLGDNIRYSISGTVQNAKDGKNISNVKVEIDCKGVEKSIYQDKKGITDLNGEYELSGYWPLHKCQIIFKHEGYKLATISINENHLITAHGLSWTYKVNGELMPLKSN